jgi:nucleotidyltransferase/DNA polymerase involved in DNA repair
VRAGLGLPISVGVARTKHLAKIASQVAKPDGLVVVDPDTELEFLHHLPVGLMWGVGPVTKARLAEIGVLTVLATVAATVDLAGVLSRQGAKLTGTVGLWDADFSRRSLLTAAARHPPRSRKSTMLPEKGVKTALNMRLQKDALSGLRRNVHESGDRAQWFHYRNSACAGRRVISSW